MHHAFKLGEAEYEVELSRAAHGYRLHADGATVAVNLTGTAGGEGLLMVGTSIEPVSIATHGDTVFVHLDGAAYELVYEHPLDRLAQQSKGSKADAIRAPMPGSVIAVQVRAGQAVTRGQTLLVMESMKMETTIAAPRDGVIEAVYFGAGQTFQRDALLVSFAAEA